MMKLTFLGTGTSTGVPTLGCQCDVCMSTDPHDKRMRCSSLLEVDGKNILFDCGPDFRQQAINANLFVIDALMLTHAHADHVAGMDDLRTVPYARYHWQLPEEISSGEKPLPNIHLYGANQTIESIKKMFFYCFPDVSKNNYKGMLPLLQLHEVDSSLKPFTVADGAVTITPISAMHSYLPVLGYRIKNFAYLTDLKTIEDCEVEKLKGLDVLVLGMLRHTKPHISHLSLDEAMAIINKVKPKQTYFVHMSHDIGYHKNFHNLTYKLEDSEEEIKVPDNCHLAYDGLVVNIED